MMPLNIEKELAQMRRMTVDDLREKFSPAPRPAPRPIAEDVDSDAKTTAFSIADMGLDVEEPAPVSPRPAPRAAAAPAAQYNDEKTTAFSVADLPPEDDHRPAPSTLVGSAASRPGAAVRGGAAPAKRQETLALAPGAARAAMQQAQAKPEAYDEDKTSAISADDIAKLEAMKAARMAGKPAAAAPVRPAPKVEAYDEDKTAAISPEDVAKLEAMKAARGGGKPAAKAPPAQISQDERTVAVPLDDAIAAIEAAPARKPSAAGKPQRAAAPVVSQDEKTTAMSIDDIDAIDAAPPRRAAAMPDTVSPVKAKAAAGRGAALDLEASEGFVGAIGYAFKHDALDAQMKAGKVGRVALDPARKAAGIRNLIIVGGGLGALMLLFGIIW